MSWFGEAKKRNRRHMRPAVAGGRYLIAQYAEPGKVELPNGFGSFHKLKLGTVADAIGNSNNTM